MYIGTNNKDTFSEYSMFVHLLGGLGGNILLVNKK